MSRGVASTLRGRSSRSRWLLDSSTGWWPQVYEAFFTRTRWGRALRAAERETIAVLLRPCLSAGDKVLEFGAGTGTYTDLLSRWGARVDVREPSPSMRRYLQRRARRAWPSVHISDGRLPHDPRTAFMYDVVLAVGVLNYVPDLRQAFITMAERTRPGGFVMVNVPTERPAGARYRRIELLGRRRIYRRSRESMEDAGGSAGLRIEAGPIAAGVTDVYRFRSTDHLRTVHPPSDGRSSSTSGGGLGR